jgi:hypothetical protein
MFVGFSGFLGLIPKRIEPLRALRGLRIENPGHSTAKNAEIAKRKTGHTGSSFGLLEVGSLTTTATDIA